jgi:hypothetical protein
MKQVIEPVILDKKKGRGLAEELNRKARAGLVQQPRGRIKDWSEEVNSMYRRVNTLGLAGRKGSGIRMTPNHLGLDTMFEEMLGAKPEDHKALADLVKLSRLGDMAARQELNTIRIEKVDGYIRAMSRYLDFFKVINLKDDEAPFVEQSNRRETQVSYVTEDGPVRSMKVTKQTNLTGIPLHTLSSQTVTVPLRDIYTGSIAKEANATVDIGYDMTAATDRIAYELYLTASGNFVTTGLETSRTFVTNTFLNTANLPLLNNIILPDNTEFVAPLLGQPQIQESTALFRTDVIDAAIWYCNSWGGALEGGDLFPTGVIKIPSSEFYGLSKQFKPVGQAFNDVANKITQSYLTFEWMGIQWVLEPDVTLPLGTCYFVMNQPVGHWYTKTSQDQEHYAIFPQKNYEERSLSKVIGGYIAQQWTPRFLSVTYHD